MSRMRLSVFFPGGVVALSFALLLFLFSACSEEVMLVPKPRAYPKVSYPEKGYQAFDAHYCAFTFEYPIYAEIQQDTTFFDEKPAHPCWFDIYIPQFDSRLHFTYSTIKSKADYNKLKSDAFELMDWHKKRANSIEEIPIQRPSSNLHGFAFNIEGPAASPFQFFVSDSTKHFLRGALYFNTQARPDSLAPIYRFVKEDILHLIETLEWNAAQ